MILDHCWTILGHFHQKGSIKGIANCVWSMHFISLFSKPLHLICYSRRGLDQVRTGPCILFVPHTMASLKRLGSKIRYSISRPLCHFLGPETDTFCQFLGPGTEPLCQFLDPKNFKMSQFLFNFSCLYWT